MAVYPNVEQTADRTRGRCPWVFFASMAFEADGRLRIVDEAGRAWRVDVTGRVAAPAEPAA